MSWFTSITLNTLRQICNYYCIIISQYSFNTIGLADFPKAFVYLSIAAGIKRKPVLSISWNATQQAQSDNPVLKADEGLVSDQLTPIR